MNVLYEERLYLATDLKHFVPWLEQYLAERSDAEVPEVCTHPEGPGPVWMSGGGAPLTPQEVRAVWPSKPEYYHRAQMPRIILRLMEVAPMQLEVAIQCHHPWAYIKNDCEEPYRRAVSEIASRTAQVFPASAHDTSADDLPQEDGKREKGGRPPLGGEELLYRLAMAERTEEIRDANPGLHYRRIAKKIQWRYGTHEAGLALLRDARHRLHGLQKDDPDGLLEEVAEFRADMEARETRET
jgi:hypothetical protein